MEAAKDSSALPTSAPAKKPVDEESGLISNPEEETGSYCLRLRGFGEDKKGCNPIKFLFALPFMLLGNVPLLALRPARAFRIHACIRSARARRCGAVRHLLRRLARADAHQVLLPGRLHRRPSRVDHEEPDHGARQPRQRTLAASQAPRILPLANLTTMVLPRARSGRSRDELT